MLKTLTLLSLVLFANTAWTAPSCTSFLQATNLNLYALRPHSLRRADPQAWDVAEHGFIVRQSDPEGLAILKEVLSKRDGTYPLIIDAQQNLVIDHRLPESSFADVSATAFVGNHLGLYNKLKSSIQVEPEVVFAGQIRVVGGRVLNLIDQSGSFYFSPEDMGFTGVDGADKLIEHNQTRLDLAAAHLKDLSIITENTKIKNFQQTFRNYGDSNARNDGHVLAKDAAEFERACRNSTSCWSKHQRIDSAMRKLLNTFGDKSQITKFFLGKMRENPATQAEGFETLQIWILILSEGVTDFLSKPGALDPETQTGSMVENLLENFDQLNL